jgi:hypothetical protein
MSRFAFWTILIGSEPTAFRAATADELRPTLVQLQRTHPEARLQWFERGTLWASPDDARAARERARRTARTRPSTWRPGGSHVDPRQKYKDAKKAKWTRFKERLRERAARHTGPATDAEERGPRARKPAGPKPTGAKPTGPRPTGPRPTGPKPPGHRPARATPAGTKPPAPPRTGRDLLADWKPPPRHPRPQATGRPPRKPRKP